MSNNNIVMSNTENAPARVIANLPSNFRRHGSAPKRVTFAPLQASSNGPPSNSLIHSSRNLTNISQVFNAPQAINNTQPSAPPEDSIFVQACKANPAIKDGAKQWLKGCLAQETQKWETFIASEKQKWAAEEWTRKKQQELTFFREKKEYEDKAKEEMKKYQEEVNADKGKSNFRA